MPQQVGLPREISVTSGAETTDRELPVDTHTPHLVDNSATERFYPRNVITPMFECFPSHAPHPPSHPLIGMCVRPDSGM